MKTIKFFSAICLICTFSIFLNACEQSRGNNASAINAPIENTVAITSTQFQPSTITVVPGTEITWTNMDTTTHAVVSDNGTSFNSGTINPKGSYSFTVTQNGSYTYHCSIHPELK